MRWLAALLCLGALSCSADLPEGRFACDHDDDCPEAWVCAPDNRCYSSEGAVPEGQLDPGDGDGDGDGDRMGLSDAELAQCDEAIPLELGIECKVCTCNACGDEIQACDQRCWELVECAFTQCSDGSPDCISTSCSGLMNIGVLSEALTVVACASGSLCLAGCM